MILYNLFFETEKNCSLKTYQMSFNIGIFSKLAKLQITLTENKKVQSI